MLARERAVIPREDRGRALLAPQAYADGTWAACSGRPNFLGAGETETNIVAAISDVVRRAARR